MHCPRFKKLNETCKNHRKYNEQKIQNVFDVENGMVSLVRQN